MPVPESSTRPPKISVVMAAYNREQEIAEAIDSVLAQDFEDFELIVVDDGSTDATGEIVRRYSAVRYLHQKNGGVGAARNAGIRAARGEYLAYCDADDVQFPFRLGAQKAVLDALPQVGMVFADFNEWIDGQVKNESLLRNRWLGPSPRRFEEELEHHFQRSATCRELGVPVPEAKRAARVYSGRIDGWLCAVHPAWGCAQMSRLAAVREIGGHWEAIRAYEDWILSAEMSKRHELAYLDVPICKYRLHPHQLTGKQRLNAECYRDGLLHTWKSDRVFYSKHKAAIDRAMATAYAGLGELEAQSGNWAEAEELFRRALVEDPGVGRRPWVNLVLTSVKHRLPFTRKGLFTKLLPGYLGQAANTGVKQDE